MSNTVTIRLAFVADRELRAGEHLQARLADIAERYPRQWSEAVIREMKRAFREYDALCGALTSEKVQ